MVNELLVATILYLCGDHNSIYHYIKSKKDIREKGIHDTKYDFLYIELTLSGVNSLLGKSLFCNHVPFSLNINLDIRELESLVNTYPNQRVNL